MDSSEKRVVSVSGNDDLLYSNVFSGGQRLNMEIINQYGQLMGDYSKLDDELWLSAPEDCVPENEEGTAFCSEGLDWKIVPSSEEHIDNLQLSEYADNSLTGGSMTSLENNSSSLNDSSQNQSRTISPISVLRKRSFSNESTFIIKRARSKHRHPTKGRQVRTKKLTDLLQLHSVDKTPNPNPNPNPTQQRNPQMELVKKCVDCDSSNTPQWRDGPEGRKTLCNACGLRYKKSLLSGYYVPLRIIKPPQLQVVKKCLHCESADTPQWRDGPEGPKTLCNACGIQHRKGRPLRTPGSNRGPYKKKVKETLVTENSEIDHNYAIKANAFPDMTQETGDMKKDKEMVVAERSKIDHNYAIEVKAIPDMTWETGDMKKDKEMIVTEKSEIDHNYAIEAKAIPDMTRETGDMKKDKEMIVTENSEIDLNHAIEAKAVPDMTREIGDMKKVKEMILTESSDNDHNYAGKAKTLKEMFGSDSDSDFEPIPRRKSPDLDFEPTLRRKRPDLDFKPIPRRKLPKVGNKKCAHCETTETPQWREGPLGRKTLCNACGVQYRHGRLFPEYRPLQSPSYDPSLHSHLPKKVEKMRMEKLREGPTTSADNDKPLVRVDG